MRKNLVLLCCVVLCACGGGNGGSSGGKQSMLRPSITPTEKVAREANFKISSNIDNEEKRYLYVVDTLGVGYYASVSHNTVSGARATRPPRPTNEYCSSLRECNDVAFSNMKKWLIDNIDDVDNWEDNSDLRDALKLAGFSDKAGDEIDTIKTWAQANKSEIEAKAQEIYDDMGEHEDFDITKSDLSVASDMGEDVKVKFVFGSELDNRQIISGIEYVVNYAPGVSAVLAGTRVNNQDTKFAINTKLYKYTLTGIGRDYDPSAEDGRQIVLMSDAALGIKDIKARLKKLADYYKANNIFFDTFGTWPDGVPLPEGKTQQEAIIDAVYEEVCTKIASLTQLNPEIKNINTELDFQSAGKGLGLSYSDFGFVNINGDNEVFHGGYSDNKIELATVRNLHKNITFTGKAVGMVEKFTETGDVRQVAGTLPLEGDASLVVTNAGDETLTALFDNWYDVTVERDSDNHNQITFNNFATSGDESYKFKRIDNTGAVIARDDSTRTITDFTNQQMIPNISDADSTVRGQGEGALVLDYFGPTDTDNPTEFSGMVKYTETVPYNDGQDRNAGIEFMMGFGGKKQY